MDAVNFFSKEEKALIKSAVQEAELNTSGEIRVHIENRCREDVMAPTALGEGPKGFSLEASFTAPVIPYSRSSSSMGLPG